MTASPGVIFFLLLLATSLIQGHPSQPSEFLRSFLSRANLLPNSSYEANGIAAEDEDLILQVDNWSEYSLVYSAHAVASGALEAVPRDLGQQERGFVLRTKAATENSMAGMVGFTLVTGEGVKTGSRLSLAWNISVAGVARIAVSLGTAAVQQFEQIWFPVKNEKTFTQVGDDSQQLVCVADERITAAANLTRDNGHYIMTVTVVPQNVDVWGWVKYFRHKEEEKGTTTSSSSSPGWRKRSQENAPSRQQDIDLLPRIAQSEKANEHKVAPGGGGDRGELPLVGSVHGGGNGQVANSGFPAGIPRLQTLLLACIFTRVVIT